MTKGDAVSKLRALTIAAAMIAEFMTFTSAFGAVDRDCDDFSIPNKRPNPISSRSAVPPPKTLLIPMPKAWNIFAAARHLDVTPVRT
jgi:hypothetical protein